MPAASTGRTLSVGTTRYTLGFLLDAVERVTEDYERDDVDLKVTHVRTGDLFAKLRSKELDLVCGSVVVTEADEAELLAPYEVMEWRRSGLSLLTNLPPERLPVPPSAPATCPGCRWSSPRAV